MAKTNDNIANKRIGEDDAKINDKIKKTAEMIFTSFTFTLFEGTGLKGLVILSISASKAWFKVLKPKRANTYENTGKTNKGIVEKSFSIKRKTENIVSMVIAYSGTVKSIKFLRLMVIF